VMFSRVDFMYECDKENLEEPRRSLRIPSKCLDLLYGLLLTMFATSDLGYPVDGNSVEIPQVYDDKIWDRDPEKVW